MSTPLVSSTPIKSEKSHQSISAEYTQVSSEDIIIDKDETTLSIEKVNDGSSTESELTSDNSSNMLFNSFIKIHVGVTDFYKSNHTHVKMGISAVLIAAYVAYFVAAMVLCSQRNIRDPTPLIVVTIATFIMVIIWLLKKNFKEKIYTALIKPMKNALKNRQTLLQVIKIFRIEDVTSLFWRSRGIIHNIFDGSNNFGRMDFAEQALGSLKINCICVLLVSAAIAVVVFSVWDQPRNLVSICGYVLFLFILLLCSAHPTQVNWRPVIGGLALQFFFAALILKWGVGRLVFEFLGAQIQAFLGFTNTGTEFVFGAKYTDHPFAMKVLPVIVFFSCAISVLYYIGAMEIVIGKIAWIMRMTLGTTAPESLCAAGNIFVGQAEAPILIQPFLALMTRSELHAVLTGGFATIAGGVLAAYISFGVAAEHLLCASVMNAPGALAVSKLLYPETEMSKLSKVSDLKKEEKTERNILEAAAAGASASIKLVANIAANLIAFLAMLAFVNDVLSWFGSYVGYPEFSFQMICSYVFMPVAYLMGVEWQDCGVVGELIGIKTFLNEFLAYGELAMYIKNKKLCVGPVLAARSEIISTYALCGFANLSSIGMQLGALGPMAPSRKGDLAQVILRALLGGIITSLMTACIAGLLVPEVSTQISCGNSTIVNTTLIVNASSPLSFVTTSVYNITGL